MIPANIYLGGKDKFEAMDDRQNELYNKMEGRYKDGDVPWDDELPPPEVIELVSNLTPGRALDLGSGYGRAAIFMAILGWQVDAIEFIPDAAANAAVRAREAGVSPRFHIASVLDLEFLSGGFDLALDVGCGHNLGEDGLVNYCEHLRTLIRPGGCFLIFARIRDQYPEEENGPTGIGLDHLISTFSQGFELEWQSTGETEVEDGPPWPSGWFRFRRTR